MSVEDNFRSNMLGLADGLSAGVSQVRGFPIMEEVF